MLEVSSRRTVAGRATFLTPPLPSFLFVYRSRIKPQVVSERKETVEKVLQTPPSLLSAPLKLLILRFGKAGWKPQKKYFFNSLVPFLLTINFCGCTWGAYRLAQLLGCGKAVNSRCKSRDVSPSSLLPNRSLRFKITRNRSLAFLQLKPELFDFKGTRAVFPECR